MNLIPTIECQSQEAIKVFQEKKLNELLSYLATHSPFYQTRFKRWSIHPDDVRFLEDLAKIPTTTKSDLQLHNTDFICVPRKKIVEYTSTSGTLGKPVSVVLTQNDISRLAYNECVSFACAGGTPQDTYQLMLTLDRQFMAGIAYYEGIRKLGAAVIRVGPGIPAMQWETIERYKPSVLVGVPSFLVKLIEYAEQQHIDLNRSSVKSAVCIGESLRTPDFELNVLGKRIRDSWDMQLYSTYASTEMQTAFTECSCGKGGHHHPELVIVEIVDDEGTPVADGVAGEVTVTTLGVEGMPLLRYRTGDIAIRHVSPCSCGRNTFRISPIIGRKQHMIKLKGTTIYPQGIFDILNETQGVADYVVEVFSGNLGTDELRLHIHLKEEGFAQTETALRNNFKAKLRVVPDIRLLQSKDIEQLQLSPQSRKIKRFIDNRN